MCLLRTRASIQELAIEDDSAERILSAYYMLCTKRQIGKWLDLKTLLGTESCPSCCAMQRVDKSTCSSLTAHRCISIKGHAGSSDALAGK